MINEPEQIVFYAIRVKGTNKYLPMRERQYGHSFSEPTSIEEKPPRLFFNEKQVKAALSSWLLGEHRKTRKYIDIVPKKDRKRENMEIVIFRAYEIIK